MLSYYSNKHSEKFSATLSVIYDFASFWHPKWGAYAQLFQSRIKHHEPGRASHETSNKKQCFQHVRPPTFRSKFHHSSMAMMTCQLSPCERYHPVRRWWNHFIIYKSHPSTVMLKIPYGFKKYSLHSNTACQFKM